MFIEIFPLFIHYKSGLWSIVWSILIPLSWNQFGFCVTRKLPRIEAVCLNHFVCTADSETLQNPRSLSCQSTHVPRHPCFQCQQNAGKKFQLKMLNKFGKSWSNFTSFAAFWRRAVQSSHWLNCTKHETSRKSHRFVECKIEQNCTFLNVKHKDWNVCFRLKFTMTTIVVILLMMNFTERLRWKVAKTSEQMWINWLEMYSCLWPEKLGFSDVKKERFKCMLMCKISCQPCK